MASLTPFFITGYSKGFQNYQKPFLLPDQAWSTLENEYTWRERLLKREGNALLGQLQRVLTAQVIGTTVSSQLTYTFPDILTTLGLRATEPNAQLNAGTLVIDISAPDSATFTDNGNGTFSVTGVGVASGSYVDYATGKVVLHLSAAVGGATITASFGYFPGLPGMGIWTQDGVVANQQYTIWWDQKYAYIYSAGAFSEFIPGTTWTGNNSQFFWTAKYQSAEGIRTLFETNFNINDPMYYTNYPTTATWVPFTPAVDSTNFLFTAKVLIPYYGRLLALNTYEGTTTGTATNYFTRCRFSWIGDPTNVNAFRSDMFGYGGFLDAPTQSQIIGATFVKNTLVVDFETSTWQLRYVGEYGLPFIWERVSADFGSGSQFSGVLFDNDRLSVGSLAITTANAIGVNRIDLDIPDQVFGFQNNPTNMGAARVWGIRNYQKELVYWNYPDSQTEAAPGVATTFPNKILLYNYRNKTWAIFRDNSTCFGTFQEQTAINWNSPTVTWDDQDVTWDDPINQPGFPSIVKLNQQGFAHQLAAQTEEDPSLFVSGVGLSGGGILQLTIPNHNLMNGEVIMLTGLEFISNSTFLPVPTSLNNTIYGVYEVVDVNTIQIAYYDTNQTLPGYVVLGINAGNWPFTPNLATSIYVGGGVVTLFPRPNLISKDINLSQSKGLQTKLSRIDFLLEPQPNNTAVTVNLILNSAPSVTANILITPTNFLIQNNTTLSPGDPIDYTWFSFYQTLSAQYFRIQLTYDDLLMNTLTTHQSHLTLYAINAWTRPAGRLVAGGS